MRRRTRGGDGGSLTSLLDVLFIIVFAALVQGRGARGAAAPPPAPGPAVASAAPPPASFAALRDAAVTAAAQHVARAPLVIARIGADGVLVELEVARERRALAAPLLESVADPDVALAYAGERDAARRVCAQLARALGRADLAGHVVVIAPARALIDLPVALVAGLRRDVDRCPAEQRALAVLLEPGAVTPPANGGTPP